MRHCRVCDTDKPETEFYASCRHVCKPCRCEQARKQVRAPRPGLASDPRKLNRERLLARKALNNAIARGEVTRESCEVCGDDPAEAHHEDYAYPLSVVWLCRKCHRKWHRKYA